MRFLPSPTILLVLIALGVPLRAVRAQNPEAAAGERIRFEAPGIVAGRYTGTILRRTGDTLLVGSPDAAPINVPLARISRLDVSRGRSAKAGALRGLGIGAVLGGVAGLIGGVVLLSEENAEGSLAVLVLPVVVAAEAALGGVVGGAIGAVVQREVWEGSTLVGTRLGVGVRARTLRLGLHRSF